MATDDDPRPRRIRRRWALALVLALLAAGAVYTWRGALSVALARHLAAERIAADGRDGLPDGLHVGVCGAGSPFPDLDRAGPCTVVLAGRRLLVFDAGSGAARNIGRLGFVHGHIAAVFLTHFHSDHIDGLGELLLQRWVTTGNAAPTPVYGPPGVADVVDGLRSAYTPDRGYRVAHHGEAALPAGGFGAQAHGFTPRADAAIPVLRDGDLEVEAFAVDHAPAHPAVGYRVRYRGRSVVISGDTRRSALVQRMAQGADVLVHEALSERLMAVLEDGARSAGRERLAKIFHDVLDYHTTPEQAAQIAHDAGVRFLLLNHIAPALPLPGLEQAFLGDAPRIFGGPIRVASDGDFLSLPAGSREVRLERRFR